MTTDENEILNGTGSGPRPIEEVPPGIVKTRAGGREFNLTGVTPIPCRRAPYVVRVDGIDYAGFYDRAAANDAMHAWRQRWPAAGGKILDIKENR